MAESAAEFQLCADARRKAEEFLLHWCDEPGRYGDQEALVYWITHGEQYAQNRTDDVRRIWANDVSRVIDAYKEQHFLRAVEDQAIIRMPSVILPDFWKCDTGCQRLTIDATMLRVAENCGFMEFDAWWDRWATEIRHRHRPLPRSSADQAVSLFSWSRSDLAIQLLGPQVIMGAIPEPREEYLPLSRLDAEQTVLVPAATLFASYRLHLLRLADMPFPLMANLLLTHQSEDGGWPIWQEDGVASSALATAMAVHALCICQIRSWQTAVAKALQWLLRHQHPHYGFWYDNAFPDRVFLTVLVLDAINMAMGYQPTTCGTQSTMSAEPSEKAQARRASNYLTSVSSASDNMPPLTLESLNQLIAALRELYHELKPEDESHLGDKPVQPDTQWCKPSRFPRHLWPYDEQFTIEASKKSPRHKHGRPPREEPPNDNILRKLEKMERHFFNTMMAVSQSDKRAFTVMAMCHHDICLYIKYPHGRDLRQLFDCVMGVLSSLQNTLAATSPDGSPAGQSSDTDPQDQGLYIVRLGHGICNMGQSTGYIQRIADDQFRTGVECPYRAYKSLKRFLRKHKYSDVASSLRWEQETVRTTIPPGKLRVDIVK